MGSRRARKFCAAFTPGRLGRSMLRPYKSWDETQLGQDLLQGGAGEAEQVVEQERAKSE